MSSLLSHDPELIDLLIDAWAQFSRYFSMFIFIIGNILNILTLSQQSFHKIPCAFDFLVLSIVSLISIEFGLITRVLSDWALDPIYTIAWLCKLHTFVVFLSRATVFWLIGLATIDRWLLSSVEIHRRGTLFEKALLKLMKMTFHSIICHHWCCY